MHRPETNYSGPDVCALPAREAVRLLKSRAITPRELLDAALERIVATNDAVNATIHVCPERAQHAITTLPDQGTDHPGWLAGLPLGIKDLIDVAGLPSTCGSPALVDNVPTRSDPLIERLEARGGVIGGKTNTPEFGTGANTFNAVFGMTRNPWDTARNAGGSSGGSAAALATGQFWLCHGSDLAGSLRTPASFCSVVGLRPCPGRAGGGPPGAGFSLESVQGPMARDVRDTALLLDSMAGFDARHPISLPEPHQSFQAALATNPGTIRVAFTDDLGGFAPVEQDIQVTLGGALAQVTGDGIVVEGACPDLTGLNETYTTLRGIHFGSVTDYLPVAAKKAFKRTLRENVEFGRHLTPAAIFAALRGKSQIYETMRRFLEEFDVLALPVTGIAPGPVEVEYPPVVAGVAMGDYVEWLRFSFLASTAGLPALSLPAGFTPVGMPVGLQLIGPPRGEARLLQVALALEERLAVSCKPIDPRGLMVGDERIELPTSSV